MKPRALLYAAGALIWASLPFIALAAGLVPCQGAADCNICTFGQLIQNIINFAIGLSIPLSAALFAYAGWLYFSNRENTSQIEKAHKIFTSVLIGFCIVLAGWLVVQTLLKTLAPGYQSWTTFNCANLNRPMNSTIGQLFQSSGLPTVVPVIAGGGGTAYTCGAGQTLSNGGCYNNSDGNYVGQANFTSSTANSGYTCPDGFSPVGTQCFNNDNPDPSLAIAATPPPTAKAYNCPAGYNLDPGNGFEDDSGNSVSTVSCVKTDAQGNVTDEVSASCGAGYTLANGDSSVTSDTYSGRCINNTTGAVADALADNTTLGVGTGDCSPANLQTIAGTGSDGIDISTQEANTLSCINRYEAGGCNNMATPGGNSSASGAFQILVGYSGSTPNPDNATQSHDLNFDSCLQAALAANYTIEQINASASGGQGVAPDSGGLYCSHAPRAAVFTALQSGHPSGNALADACVAASRNLTCNTQAAAMLVADKDQSASPCTLFSDWLADPRASGQASCINNSYGLSGANACRPKAR